jgi:outer membrane receptor protein involved in Fe transport
MLIDNAVKFDSYWLVDTRLGLTEDNWEFLIYVNNLFDDDTFQTGGSGPDFGTQVTRLGFTAGLGTSHYFAVLPDPRTFGAMLTINF